MSDAFSDRERWWCVIGYEITMLRAALTIEMTVNGPADNARLSKWLLDNLIAEGKILHIRNLCDFCTSRKPDDIKPCDLFDDYHTDDKYVRLRKLIESLSRQYGASHQKNSPRWVFNKKLAHPTKERGKRFEYGPYLNQIRPLLEKIIIEVESLRGRPFA